MTPWRAGAGRRPRRPWFTGRPRPRRRSWFARRSGSGGRSWFARRPGRRPWLASRSRPGPRPWFARPSRPRRPWFAGRGERGNAALELVILAPVIVLLIGMVVAAGRTTIAQGSVDAAARDAARQASIARSPADALADAQASASAVLAGESLDCTPTIEMPGLDQAFATPVGDPASVTAVVSCTVSLSDLLVPGLPGSRRLTGTFTSPIDPFRGRDPGSGGA
jgi:TadE-like protein